MATLTILVWLAAFGIFLSIMLADDRPEFGDDGSAGLILILPGLFVGAGVYYDLYHEFPPGSRIAVTGSGGIAIGDALLRYVLISGFCSLGFLGLVALIFCRPRREAKTASGRFASVMEILSVVSSILGIISFYLSFLR